MATQTFTDAFRLSLVEHLGTDVLKMALYTSSAELDESTTAYSATNEVTGTGYTAGGAVVSVQATFPKIVNNRAEVRFDDVAWAGSTITARYGLIYNTSDSNAAVMTLDFGGDQSSLGNTFTVRLDDGVNAMISI